MKKFLISLCMIISISGIGIAVSASTNCKTVNFGNTISACTNITYASSNTWNLTTSIQGSTTASLLCDIMTPDNTLHSISNCNGQFTYAGTNVGRIKLWIRHNLNAPTQREGKPNNDSEWLYPQRTYNRSTRRRTSDTIEYIPNTTNFLVSSAPTHPQTNERTNITIRARDGSTTDTSYRGTVRFRVERRSGSSWVTAATSLYDISRNSYTFSASDHGQITLNNMIRFKQTNEYRITIYDDVDHTIQGTRIRNVTQNQYSYNTNNFLVSTNNTVPATQQRVSLAIRARNGTVTDTSYRGTIDFEVYYRASGSTQWVRTTSSTYYTMHSNYQNGYTFSIAQNGYININNFIRFNRANFAYKVVVYDRHHDTVIGERIFTVGNVDSTPSTVAGFSVNELTLLTSTYNSRDTMINTLKANNPRLRTHTRRINTSNRFKQNMRDVIENRNQRTFRTYITFHNAYITRQRFTDSVK